MQQKQCHARTRAYHALMISHPAALLAIRAPVLRCRDDPGQDGGQGSAVQWLPDALLVLAEGRVQALGPYAELLPSMPRDLPILDRRDRLLVPGFIDAHVHYPQVDVIASHGTQLLDWLERYTFPAEQAFAEAEHARQTAEFFLDRLLENGTTLAAVFATVHATSVEAIFAAAEARGLPLIAGKCHMDRHAPRELTDTVAAGVAEAERLIERWHGQGPEGRFRYAITPRFAVTSSPEQLCALGALAARHPEVYIQSHVAENRAEMRLVAELFPEARSYLEVYARYGLLRERSLYAHCIHLDDEDRRLMRASGATAVFCPTSNLFLGSGLFDLRAAREAGMRVALGSDVGGGTSYSILTTLAEGYKVQQMLGQSLSPAYALYLATLGGARALGLGNEVGALAPGQWADFVLLDPAATPLLARRTALARERADPLDLFFALMILGDDRAVAETWVAGRAVYRRGD